MSDELRTGVLELELGEPYIGSAYSPQVEVADTDTGHEVAITYMSPEGLTTVRFDVPNGEQGQQGPAGFSPTVSIIDTPTGHTVTITDADGPHSYDVPNYAQEEQQRQDAWDALSGEVADAINAAQAATTAATSAAGSATSAAQAATTAATSANTAASSATSAATAANSAATAAGTAADSANAAAQDATDAASAANTAADAAQAAATEVAPKVEQLWGNQLTKELTGEVLTAADAYAAPPMALTVEGKSTQDGTPTPESPVEIVSLEQVNLTFAGKNIANPTNTASSKTSQGITFVWDGETFSANGTSTANNTDSMYIPIVNFPILRAGNTYTFSLQGTFDTGGSSTTFYFLANKLGNASATLRHIFGAANKGVWTYRPTEDTVLRSFAIRISSSDVTVNIAAKLQIELGSTATACQPYDATNVLLNLTQALRSLPDGAHDTLSFAYLKPSTREGWAWYTPTLTKLSEAQTFDGTDMSNWSVEGTTNPYWVYTWTTTGATNSDYTGLSNNNSRCTAARVAVVGDTTANLSYFNTNLLMRFRYRVTTDETVTVADLAEYFTEHPTTFIVPMQHPVVTTLDPIELPVLPAPDVTVWSDPSTGLTMEYVRDTNLAYAQLEAALADLATS